VLVLVLVFPENEKRPIARTTIKTGNLVIVLVVVVILALPAVKKSTTSTIRTRRARARGRARQGSLTNTPPDLDHEKSVMTS
jgi:hypothetical protein